VSPWALIDWLERTVLPELLGVQISKSGKDRLYHVGDALFAHRKAIEEGLRKHEGWAFRLGKQHCAL
jgi:hypothetical protein